MAVQRQRAEISYLSSLRGSAPRISRTGTGRVPIPVAPVGPGAPAQGPRWPADDTLVAGYRRGCPLRRGGVQSPARPREVLAPGLFPAERTHRVGA